MAQTPEYVEQLPRKLIHPVRHLCKKSKTPPDAYKDIEADYIINMHLDTIEFDWMLTLTLVSVNSEKIPCEIVTKFKPDNPGANIIELWENVRKNLMKHCGINNCNSPIDYVLPTGDAFNHYLGALSQSLALSIVTVNPRYAESVYGVRDIMNYLLDLALEDTKSDVARLLYISALAKNKETGSEIYLDYQSKVETLLAEFPLSYPAAEVISMTMRALYTE